jgi:hypothetical protein
VQHREFLGNVWNLARLNPAQRKQIGTLVVPPGGVEPRQAQNVNAYHSRLKKWMVRFYGVSTKWLERYLGWWRMLDRRQTYLTPDEVLLYAII